MAFCQWKNKKCLEQQSSAPMYLHRSHMNNNLPELLRKKPFKEDVHTRLELCQVSDGHDKTIFGIVRDIGAEAQNLTELIVVELEFVQT
jgi:hypothetical protein